MLKPNDAFLRLNKDGPFDDQTGEVVVQWYWHQLGNGFQIMACRSIEGYSAPTLYREFYVSSTPIARKRYFNTQK